MFRIGSRTITTALLTILIAGTLAPSASAMVIQPDDDLRAFATALAASGFAEAEAIDEMLAAVEEAQRVSGVMPEEAEVLHSLLSLYSITFAVNASLATGNLDAALADLAKLRDGSASASHLGLEDATRRIEAAISKGTEAPELLAKARAMMGTVEESGDPLNADPASDDEERTVTKTIRAPRSTESRMARPTIDENATGNGTAADPDIPAQPWTSVNDGEGSGLDADLLDGMSSEDFLQLINATNLDLADAEARLNKSYDARAAVLEANLDDVVVRIDAEISIREGAVVDLTERLDSLESQFNDRIDSLVSVMGNQLRMHRDDIAAVRSDLVATEEKLNATIAAEAATRAAGLSDIAATIADETSRLDDAVATLRADLDTMSTRHEALISEERALRERDFTSLRESLDDETAARTTEVARLDARIDNFQAQSADEMWETTLARDGSGSTLNADFLDGLDAATFLRRDKHTETVTGDFFANGGTAGFKGSDLILKARGGGAGNNGGSGRALVDAGAEGLIVNFGNDFGNVRIQGPLTAEAALVAKTTLTVNGKLMPMGSVELQDNAGTKHVLEKSAQSTGMSFRTLVNPTEGGSIFTVRSSGLSERLAVEHEGVVRTSNPDIYVSAARGEGNVLSGHKVWHQGNDGTDSSLDADLLDGFDASDFVREDQPQVKFMGPLTASGGITVDGTATFTGDVNALLGTLSVGSMGIRFHDGTVQTSGVMLGEITSSGAKVFDDARYEVSRFVLTEEQFLGLIIAMYGGEVEGLAGEGADAATALLQLLPAPIQEAFEWIIGAVGSIVEAIGKAVDFIRVNIIQFINNIIGKINGLLEDCSLCPSGWNIPTITPPTSIGADAGTVFNFVAELAYKMIVNAMKVDEDLGPQFGHRIPGLYRVDFTDSANATWSMVEATFPGVDATSLSNSLFQAFNVVDESGHEIQADDLIVFTTRSALGIPMPFPSGFRFLRTSLSTPFATEFRDFDVKANGASVFLPDPTKIISGVDVQVNDGEWVPMTGRGDGKWTTDEEFLDGDSVRFQARRAIAQSAVITSPPFDVHLPFDPIVEASYDASTGLLTSKVFSGVPLADVRVKQMAEYNTPGMSKEATTTRASTTWTRQMNLVHGEPVAFKIVGADGRIKLSSYSVVTHSGTTMPPHVPLDNEDVRVTHFRPPGQNHRTELEIPFEAGIKRASTYFPDGTLHFDWSRLDGDMWWIPSLPLQLEGQHLTVEAEMFDGTIAGLGTFVVTGSAMRDELARVVTPTYAMQWEKDGAWWETGDNSTLVAEIFDPGSGTRPQRVDIRHEINCDGDQYGYSAWLEMNSLGNAWSDAVPNGSCVELRSWFGPQFTTASFMLALGAVMET